MNNANDSMITISLYFEVHDGGLFGGKGSVGYTNTNADFKVSEFAKADLINYVEAHRQGVAEMCKAEKEKVFIISRTDYEKETEDEEDYDDWE